VAPILDRRRVQDLDRPVRELQGRILDLGVSAGRTRPGGATLTREDEIELLSRALAEAVLVPELRSAFKERLLLLQCRGDREGGS
jgi:hypothetical protein